jgi:hypothetical protein
MAKIYQVREEYRDDEGCVLSSKIVAEYLNRGNAEDHVEALNDKGEFIVSPYFVKTVDSADPKRFK